MRPPSDRNVKYDFVYEVTLSAIFVALNASFTALICFRLFSMRHKADRVLGRLQATLYNSYSTLFVESGGFFTIWTVATLIAKVMNGWVQNAFLEPYKYILVSVLDQENPLNCFNIVPDYHKNVNHPTHVSKSCLDCRNN